MVPGRHRQQTLDMGFGGIRKPGPGGGGSALGGEVLEPGWGGEPEHPGSCSASSSELIYGPSSVSLHIPYTWRDRSPQCTFRK